MLSARPARRARDAPPGVVNAAGAISLAAVSGRLHPHQLLRRYNFDPAFVNQLCSTRSGSRPASDGRSRSLPNRHKEGVPSAFDGMVEGQRARSDFGRAATSPVMPLLSAFGALLSGFFSPVPLS